MRHLKAVLAACLLALVLCGTVRQLTIVVSPACAALTPDDWFWWWYYDCGKDSTGGGGSGAGD